jgi:hypothetical protein
MPRARALTTEIPEQRSLALLVPSPQDKRGEAEFIFPRTAISDSADLSSQTVTSIRALIDLNNPTRFHRDLLHEMRIPDGAGLADISRLWREKFSVERVTPEFYKEYATVRDRMAAVLTNTEYNFPKNAPDGSYGD